MRSLAYRILLLGGLTLALFGGTAEAQSWSTTGWMATPRVNHTETLLPNGQVLVVGGYNLQGGPWPAYWVYLARAEVYDLASGAWKATGPLATPRASHTATLLPSGKVLIAGGSDGSGPLTNAEIYDPATGTWTATAPLSTARSNHTATLLPSGMVLVAGGSGGAAPAELFDPTGNGGVGSWTSTGPLTTGRSSHTATLLHRVLVAGGAADASAEIYDPASGTWTATGSLATARATHTATLLSSGKVLVAGGTNGGVLASAEIYDPASGTWTATGSLAAARGGHTAALLPNGQVLVAGGSNTLCGICLYANPGALASAEIYDPAGGTWTPAASLATPRYFHAATLLPNGQVLVAGGTNGSSWTTPYGVFLSNAEIYDPASGAWTATASLATARYAHTATLLPSGKVLVASGGNGPVYERGGAHIEVHLVATSRQAPPSRLGADLGRPEMGPSSVGVP